jgi:hypothetical protein
MDPAHRHVKTAKASTAHWARAGLLAAALAAWMLATPALACGPSAPLTSAELLSYQMGIIDRGLAREALTTEQRGEIEKMRADVTALQNGEKRAEAREVMTKIVAMFKMKEMFGAVEPVVPGCGAPRANAVTGVLVAIEIEPNVAGARCGNHYVLSIKDGGGAISKVAIYDLAKAPYAALEKMLNKPVEAETLGTGVMGIRLAAQQQAAGAALSGLSPRKPC